VVGKGDIEDTEYRGGRQVAVEGTVKKTEGRRGDKRLIRKGAIERTEGRRGNRGP
jgi:hypothetical protein